MKITTKHASNSPVTFVTHKRFVVLFFLPSCFVHSLRSLTSKRLQEKTPLCRPFFENLHFWCRNALNGEKKLSVFRTIKIRVDGHLTLVGYKLSRVPLGTRMNKFLLYFFSAHDWSWDRDNMERATNWRANLSTELTNGRPATGKRHGNLICHCVFLPTPRPFWLEYRRFILPLQNNRVNGNVCHKATL